MLYCPSCGKASFSESVFEGMAWGTDSVFQETASVMETEGRKVHLLPPWCDVDTPQDLENLIRRHSRCPDPNSRTLAFLRDQFTRALPPSP